MITKNTIVISNAQSNNFTKNNKYTFNKKLM